MVWRWTSTGPARPDVTGVFEDSVCRSLHPLIGYVCVSSRCVAGRPGRHAGRDPLDVDAAVTELRQIAGGRADLLGEVAGRTLGFGPGVGGAVGTGRLDRPNLPWIGKGKVARGRVAREFRVAEPG
jgi:hypothetical protein